MADKIKCVHQNGLFHEFPSKEVKFRPSAYGILINEGKILLVPQWDGFDIPGGGMKINETIEQCVEREFWEETGLRVKTREIVFCSSSFFLLPNTNEPVNSILVYYLCEQIGGEISDENFDEFEKEYAKKAQWIDLNEIKNLKFVNSVDTFGILTKAKMILNLST